MPMFWTYQVWGWFTPLLINQLWTMHHPFQSHGLSWSFSYLTSILWVFFPSITSSFGTKNNQTKLSSLTADMGMDQYLLIPFLGEWTSIYQLFWCELQGYKVLTHCHITSPSVGWAFGGCCTPRWVPRAQSPRWLHSYAVVLSTTYS